MANRAPLYLGEPDFDDVEQAARLLIRYQDEGGFSPEGAQMFRMMVGDFAAVQERAAEIRAQSGAAAE